MDVKRTFVSCKFWTTPSTFINIFEFPAKTKLLKRKTQAFMRTDHPVGGEQEQRPGAEVEAYLPFINVNVIKYYK